MTHPIISFGMVISAVIEDAPTIPVDADDDDDDVAALPPQPLLPPLPITLAPRLAVAALLAVAVAIATEFASEARLAILFKERSRENSSSLF